MQGVLGGAPETLARRMSDVVVCNCRSTEIPRDNARGLLTFGSIITSSSSSLSVLLKSPPSEDISPAGTRSAMADVWDGSLTVTPAASSTSSSFNAGGRGFGARSSGMGSGSSIGVPRRLFNVYALCPDTHPRSPWVHLSPDTQCLNGNSCCCIIHRRRGTTTGSFWDSDVFLHVQFFG